MKIYDKVKINAHVFIDDPRGITFESEHLEPGLTGTITGLAAKANYRSGISATVRFDQDKKERSICASLITTEDSE